MFTDQETLHSLMTEDTYTFVECTGFAISRSHLVGTVFPEGQRNKDTGIMSFEEALTAGQNQIEHFVHSSGTQPTELYESIALGNLGYGLTLAGDPDQALAYHQQQLAIALEQQDPFEESVARSYIELALIAQSAARDALTWLNQALILSRQLGDCATEGRGLDRLGRAHVALDDPDLAFDCYAQSIAIARDLNDAAGEARTKWRKGEALIRQNNDIQGAPLMREALTY